MYKRVNARAALMGLLFAMVGFSFALATSDSRSLPSAAGSRVVGSGVLRFTNGVLGGDFDLGDVTQGSFTVRYARAAGGVRPYKFTSTVSPTLKEVLTGSTSTLDLLQNGVLTGAGTNNGGLIAGVAAANFPLRFNITVADGKGSNASSVTSRFRLSLESGTTFKFAISDLGEAVQFVPFMDVVSTVNGNGAVTVTATNVAVNGTAVTGGLEAIGLSLATDGTLFGQPLVAGVLTFTAVGKDAKGGTALSRDLSAANQVITLNLTGNITVDSDFVTTGLNLKIKNATGPKAKSGNNDSLKFKGQVNLNGKSAADLNGKVIKLSIGGYTTPNSTNTPATLDGKGNTVKAPKLAKGTSAPKLKAKVSTKGQISVSVSGEDMSRVSAFTGASSNVAVGLMVGDAVASAQILKLTAKKGNSGTSAGYKLDAANTPGGTFLLTSVKGKDDTKAAADADAWTAQFIATPPTGVSFSGVNSATVSIGSNFTGVIAVKESKSKVSQNEKKDAKSANVTQIKLDGVKGKGSIKTGPLPKTATGISAASKAKATDPNTFPLNVTLTKGGVAVYGGENSLAIFPNKTSWANKSK
jgi:hypothetical protein